VRIGDIFRHVIVVILVLAAGCAGKGKEEMLMDRARAEFADPGRKTFQNLLREKFGVNLMYMDTFDRVYNSCQVEGCCVFDHMRFPLGGPEYWAIELQFAGKDVITNEQVRGTAMMVYVNVLVEEGKRDDYLGWVMTGTTPEEIVKIEKHTRDMFTNLKKIL
jgi:hypothetical protein